VMMELLVHSLIAKNLHLIMVTALVMVAVAVAEAPKVVKQLVVLIAGFQMVGVTLQIIL